MFLCFVLDTNPRMGRPASSSLTPPLTHSLSALDQAKSAVETLLLRLRGAGPAFSHSQLLLLQSRPPSEGVSEGVAAGSVLAAGGERSDFEHALKNISCSDATHSLTPTLDTAFQLLSKYRTRSGVDHPAKGLLPWSLEQAFVVVLSNDLGSLVRVLHCTALHCTALLSDELVLADMTNVLYVAWLQEIAVVGSGAAPALPYMAAHRWDQKVFAFQIGQPAPTARVPLALTNLCQVRLLTWSDNE
jgi:hypothetical protein